MKNIKKIALLMVLGFFALSCSTNQNDKKNVALIDKYVQAVEDLDYTTIESILDESYVGVGPSMGDSIKKPEVVETLKINFENLYESIDYDRSRSIAVTIPDGPDKGQWVSNWAELTITYKEDQNRAKLYVNTVYQIDKGKIVKSMSFYNEADVLEQLGYVFINPDDL